LDRVRPTVGRNTNAIMLAGDAEFGVFCITGGWAKLQRVMHEISLCAAGGTE
jgi:hypothetical protein